MGLEHSPLADAVVQPDAVVVEAGDAAVAHAAVLAARDLGGGARLALALRVDEVVWRVDLLHAHLICRRDYAWVHEGRHAEGDDAGSEYEATDPAVVAVHVQVGQQRVAMNHEHAVAANDKCNIGKLNDGMRLEEEPVDSTANKPSCPSQAQHRD